MSLVATACPDYVMTFKYATSLVDYPYIVYNAGDNTFVFSPVLTPALGYDDV